MKLSRTTLIHPAFFGVIPLVNVLFLLLIFHTLSSNFVLQPGLAVNLPFSTFVLGPQHHPRVVTITSAPAIYYQDERFTLEGFIQKLAGAPGKEETLILKADRDAPYSLVFKIMNQGKQMGYSVVLAASDESK